MSERRSGTAPQQTASVVESRGRPGPDGMKEDVIGGSSGVTFDQLIQGFQAVDLDSVAAEHLAVIEGLVAAGEKRLQQERDAKAAKVATKAIQRATKKAAGIPGFR